MQDWVLLMDTEYWNFKMHWSKCICIQINSIPTYIKFTLVIHYMYCGIVYDICNETDNKCSILITPLVSENTVRCWQLTITSTTAYFQNDHYTTKTSFLFSTGKLQAPQSWKYMEQVWPRGVISMKFLLVSNWDTSNQQCFFKSIYMQVIHKM